MNDSRHSPSDVPPSPERDTSREGREEEVINQQEENKVTNDESKDALNTISSGEKNTGEQQFKEGMGDNTVKLDEVTKEHIEGSNITGNEESGLPGSGI